MIMATTTVRIPEEKRDLIKIVASIEKRDIKDILSRMKLSFGSQCFDR